MGYFYESEVNEAGTFHHHGDSIRIWGVGEEYPVRLSFFDTELEAIHRFLGNERQSLEQMTLLPAREIVINAQTTKKTLTSLDSKGKRNRKRKSSATKNFT